LTKQQARCDPSRIEFLEPYTTEAYEREKSPVRAGTGPSQEFCPYGLIGIEVYPRTHLLADLSMNARTKWDYPCGTRFNVDAHYLAANAYEDMPVVGLPGKRGKGRIVEIGNEARLI
jgi:hypothetical protein